MHLITRLIFAFNLVMQVARLHGGGCHVTQPESGGLQINFSLASDPIAQGGDVGLLPVF